MANLSCIPKYEKKAIVDVWVGEDLYLMLLTKAHIPNAGTQQFVSQVVINEIVDAGDTYTAGGVAVNGKVSTPDPNVPDNYFLDAEDTRIGPGATLTYRYGILYKNMGTGNHGINPIKAQIDFLEDQVVENGISKIIWNALGIIYVS